MAATLEATQDVRVEDIAYRHRPDGGAPLLARLYRPAAAGRGAGPFPCVVDVHGGAWTGSDRFNNEAIAREFARDGIVTLALDFRMPPEAPYPASLQDINHGVRWMKAHAAELGVRAEKVGLFGTSSGGHQVLLAALRPRDPRYAALPLEGAGPAVDASVAFVVSGWGVLDPLLRYGLARERGDAKMIASHDAFWRSEATMEEGTPAVVLERGEAQAVPPALIFQGDADTWVPNAAAERLAAAWRKAGGRCELALFPGEGHTFLREKPDAPSSLKAMAMVKAFIRAEGGAS